MTGAAVRSPHQAKVVIVTGASQGIGRALCLELSPQRPRLVLAARDREALDRVAAACRERGAETMVVLTDVTDEAACRALVEQTVAGFGGIDVLVNNAGIGMLARFVDVADLRPYETLLRVNVLGSIYPTFHALPHLVRARGQVVAVSSLAGLHGVPMRTAYAASKHAQIGFFDSLRIELRGTGVDVTVVCPYWVQSEIRKRSAGPDGRTLERSPVDEQAAMTAEECARRIRRAMERRQRMLVMTWKGQLGRFLKLVAPGLVDRAAAAAVRRGR